MPSKIPVWLLWGSLLVCWTTGMFRVWVLRELVEGGYRLSSLSHERRQMSERLERLELERAALLRPERLRRIAAEKGFRAPLAHEIHAFEPARREEP